MMFFRKRPKQQKTFSRTKSTRREQTSARTVCVIEKRKRKIHSKKKKNHEREKTKNSLNSMVSSLEFVISSIFAIFGLTEMFVVRFEGSVLSVVIRRLVAHLEVDENGNENNTTSGSTSNDGNHVLLLVGVVSDGSELRSDTEGLLLSSAEVLQLLGSASGVRTGESNLGVTVSDGDLNVAGGEVGIRVVAEVSKDLAAQVSGACANLDGCRENDGGGGSGCSCSRSSSLRSRSATSDTENTEVSAIGVGHVHQLVSSRVSEGAVEVQVVDGAVSVGNAVVADVSGVDVEGVGEVRDDGVDADGDVDFDAEVAVLGGCRGGSRSGGGCCCGGSSSDGCLSSGGLGAGGLSSSWKCWLSHSGGGSCCCCR